MNKIPCLYGFIRETKTGDRNTNLFKAINHLRFYNKTATNEEIINEALNINKSFSKPLSEHEVTVVCQHVLNKQYRTSCWKFKKYCKQCRHGKFRKTFRRSKPKYWKHINEKNRLVNIKHFPDDIFHPWDIEDTDKINDLVDDNGKVIRTREEIVTDIHRLREEKGIPIAIDRIVKNYGIPIGDKAKREWERFKKRKDN